MRQARRPVVWITMAVAMVALLGIASGYLLLGGSKKNIEEGASLRLSAGTPQFDTPAAVLEQSPGNEVSTHQITQALNGLIERPEFGALNICIVDSITGDELFNDSGNLPAVPASTTKIATAYAVLSALDPEKRLSTRVIAGSAPGEIVLVSDGDPTLAASAQGFYPGAGRLDELAKQIKVSTPINRIIVHTGPFSGPSAGPSWPSEAIGSNYVNPITSVAVDAGRRQPDTEIRVSEPDLVAGRALASAL
ncbi:MAG: hypothetical protein HOQ05_08635, partial [Corynebacteriales bacterium]|nr:hypothetical protein [Mycobacteriales bacterium]